MLENLKLNQELQIQTRDLTRKKQIEQEERKY